MCISTISDLVFLGPIHVLSFCSPLPIAIKRQGGFHEQIMKDHINSKEVQITPLSIGFGTLNPPKFELGHLTPLSIKYQANYPHRPVIAVLLAVLVHVDQWF
jgi:hypothetical protein